MNEVLRQEKKYLIDLPKMYEMTKQLSLIMEEDAHNKGDGYQIRSLYFDTLEDRDFSEKMDSAGIRRKLRLRIYDPDAEVAMLEMKQKQGDSQRKRSLRMQREDARKLCQGEYSVLLQYPDPFAAECYGLMNMYCYRPKSVVEYKRRAFVAKENRIRITFDYQLVATESCFDIFSSELLQGSIMDPSLVVMEVKFNGFLLSYIKDILNTCDKSEVSVSKYCLSRAVSTHYTF